MSVLLPSPYSTLRTMKPWLYFVRYFESGTGESIKQRPIDAYAKETFLFGDFIFDFQGYLKLNSLRAEGRDMRGYVYCYAQ
jgi:hypothetical protein